MAGKVAFILTLCAVLSASLGIRRGDWRKLSKRGSLFKLARSKWPFNPWTNLAYCNKRKIWLAPDGTKDMTKTINQKLRELGATGGGTLRLTRGTFLHSRNIEIPSYVCLVGAGMSKTVLKLRDNSPRFKYSGNVRSFETERVTVMDLTINGNRYRQTKGDTYGRYGVFTELTNFLLLRRVRVTLNHEYGFDPHGSKKYWAYYLIVDDCRADRNGLDGFTIDQTVHAVITKGVSSLNDRHGYNAVTGTQLAVFRDCRSVNNGKGTGVGFGYVAQNNGGYGTKMITFERCASRDDWRGGVRLKDVNNIYVEDSTFASSGSGVCYEVSNIFRVFLRRNKCAVRRNRKIKKGAKAFFIEENDRSVFTAAVKSTPAKSLPIPKGQPDPTCKRGIWNSNVCCDARCTACAVRGCGKKANGPGGARCCVSAIRTAQRPCATFGAPCTMATFRK